MLNRHPLTLLTKEVPALELSRDNACLLLQDLHTPFTDREAGWLATQARSKVLMREFDEYFDSLDLVSPNIIRLLNTARDLGLPVVYSCLGHRPPAEPSPFQQATGWTWNLNETEGAFPAPWQPGGDELVFTKPGWGALANAEFERFLRDNTIQNVIVAGTLLDFGIRQTCVELADHSFHSLVVSDAVTSLTQLGRSYVSGNIAHGMTKLRSMGETLGLLHLLDDEGAVMI